MNIKPARLAANSAQPPTNPELLRLGHEIIDAVKYTLHSALASPKKKSGDRLQRQFLKYATTTRPITFRRAVAASQALDASDIRKAAFPRFHSTSPTKVASEGFRSVSTKISPIDIDKLLGVSKATVATIRKVPQAKLASAFGVTASQLNHLERHYHRVSDPALVAAQRRWISAAKKTTRIERKIASVSRSSVAAEYAQLADLNQQLEVAKTEQAEAATDAPFPYQSVEFHVNALQCLNETGWGFFEWGGSDCIHMGGTVINWYGYQSHVAPFYAGDFESGTISWLFRQFGPNMPFSSHDTWPKLFTAIVSIAEKDAVSTFDGFIAALVEVLQGALAAAAGALGEEIGAELGVIIGGPAAGVIGAIIGAALGFLFGWIVGELINWVINMFTDDIFCPQVVQLDLSAPPPWTGVNSGAPPWSGAVPFVGWDGAYMLYYSWRAV